MHVNFLPILVRGAMKKILIAILVAAAAASALCAQQVDPAFYNGMKWRSIGPFRAGRVSAVAGIPGNAAVYYMGSPGGGVWKTLDGGTVWTAIADQIKVASIGAIVVSPSNPDVVYVGTGDVSMVGSAANFGNGVWKSTDAGRTWTHVGLEETQHIGAMWIDPANPDVVVVAALGKTFSQNKNRGIYKTTDGGKTWKQTLAGTDEIGAIDVTFDAENKSIGYASLWHHYCPPGNTADLITGPKGGAIYKTTDNGDTWTKLTSPGLPEGDLSRIGLATAMGGKRVYAVIAGAREAGGFYRSDDAGATWAKSTTDTRVTGSGYFSRVFVDPKDADTIYVAQTSLYRSTDGGHTFISFKGAPGGDDNHALWIDPADSTRMIMASDQGATISVDKGATWSSWYNQPTAQIYHMSTDNRWPYWVYGTQQDSGSVATLSRGDYGAITFVDWDPVAAYEFGYIVPSPLDPNMVYAGGPARGLILLNRVNRQAQTISPSMSRAASYRTAMNPPLAFSPQDGHVFYMATQLLLETSDAGTHWKPISPDLTERPGSAAANAHEEQQAKATAEANTANNGKPAKTREASETLTPPNRTAINTFAPSPVAAGEIWAGTTNGLIHLTRDNGTTWTAVTPEGLTQYSNISMLEASRFDAGTAYAAVDRHEENDTHAHIYRTHDFGKTWQETVSGIAEGDFVRVVREDPVRKGLLFAGTESAAYVSFDDGDHWSDLELNMPATSVRDLQINGNDLVAATYGRSFWILDDISPLRQMDAAVLKRPVTLYKPGRTLRVQLDLNGDTPIPPELPAGENPPSGAILNFYLGSAAKQDITLAIYDSKGALVRQFDSRPLAASTEPPPNVPDYWLALPQPLPKHAGDNRFVWDLRYAPPLAIRHNYPISALYQNTPAEPQGSLVAPGTYEVRLTVDGKTYKQPLEVALDPRVHVGEDALERQFALHQQVDEAVTDTYNLYHQAVALRESIDGDEKKLGATDADAVKALKDFEAKVTRMQGSENRGGGPPGGRMAPSLMQLNQQLGGLATTVDSADSDPTPAMTGAFHDMCKDLSTVITQWNETLKTDLPALNEQLAKEKLSGLPAAELKPSSACQ
jgi:photosystem II stability/assembly factor-like uncharacterized protein